MCIRDRPIYEGVNTNWVKEFIPLDDFKGQTIQIGCKMVAVETGDGIFIDDVEVTTYSETLNNDQEEKISFINIFPNPVSDVLQISGNNVRGNGLVSIKNSLGANVFSQKDETLDQLSIDVSHLLPGIYFLEITKMSGQTFVTKWIKS